ncbi:NAD(P)/FAD-dependent oxidoreductase [uncultured Brevundimonas sp.]|uniref:dihydrolipoyl dehydrogenase family protein n=1 Tax=uncultured Brevundimonas sp. TaxID=213418 RepID=UPI0030EB52B3|tara:strand:- start:5392 stop:6732 length:1341 start_codon:yes stop_codon:yes gene_type:complete
MDYDLAIIGSGTAASVVAGRVRKADWTVVMIDHRPLGGTCALRGCDPKKMLLSGAEAVDQAVRLHGHGVAGDTRIDWQDLMRFKHSFTDPVPDKNEARWDKAGVDVLHGRARFTGPNRLDVAGTAVSARHIVIAAGAEAVALDIPGNELTITSEEFLNLERLPRRIVFIGGGYISAELSNIASRAGAQVTILQRGDRLLTGFDPDLVGWLTEGFISAGIDVRLGATATMVERGGDDYRVHAKGQDGDTTVEADLVVNTAGRRPALDDLGLTEGSVAVDDGRLKLNEWLQSESNPAVYAVGDAAETGPPLTPVSAHDGHVVAHNLLKGNDRRPNYRGVPSAAFTLPPIAAVGLSEAEARTLGRPVTVKSEHTPGWFTARRLAQPVYGYKTIVDPETDRILGAHLVGPAADEVINIFALAIRHELTVADLKSTMFAYPSAASDIGSML